VGLLAFAAPKHREVTQKHETQNENLPQQVAAGQRAILPHRRNTGIEPICTGSISAFNVDA